jgi:hypothetical protein
MAGMNYLLSVMEQPPVILKFEAVKVINISYGILNMARDGKRNCG